MSSITDMTRTRSLNFIYETRHAVVSLNIFTFVAAMGHKGQKQSVKTVANSRRSGLWQDFTHSKLSCLTLDELELLLVFNFVKFEKKGTELTSNWNTMIGKEDKGLR